MLAATNALAVMAPEHRSKAQGLLSIAGSSAIALGAASERGSLMRTACFAFGICSVGVSVYDFVRQRISGPPGWIGATFWEREDALVVHGSRPNTAAAAAGLIADDEIISVDGLPVTQIGVRDAYRRLFGPVGTQVHVVVRRRTTTNTYEWPATLIRTPT